MPEGGIGRGLPHGCRELTVMSLGWGDAVGMQVDEELQRMADLPARSDHGERWRSKEGVIEHCSV